jgi:hypothetical protein
VRIENASRTTGARKCRSLVGVARHDVLLGEHLDAVGERLRETAEADLGERDAGAVRAGAVLHAAEDLAFGEREEGEEEAEDGE